MMPTADPISVGSDALDETKAYLRIDGTDEDEPLGRIIAAAIGHGEAFTGQVLLARGIVETMPVSVAWQRLGRTPVSAITAVESAAPGADPAALPADAYAIDIDAAGDGWVRVIAPAGATRAQVQYTAGLAEGWSGLPEPLRQGIVRLASHLYTHRDAADEGAPPAAVAALWRPWRRMRLS